MDFHDPICVYTADSFRAGLIKNMLEEEGIRTYLDGENAASQMAIGAFDVGVMVEAGHADAARKLIEAHEHHKPSS